MARLVALALLAYCCLQSGFARADDTAKQFIGSWKLSSWVIQIIGGDLTEPFGPNPKGRAVFTPDGYVAFVVVAADRKPATNDEESAALLKSLMAYTGKFTIDGDKFTTKVITVPRQYGLGIMGCGTLALGFADRIERSNGSRPLRLILLVLGWVLMLLGLYLLFTEWHPQHLWPFD